jgi:uncharacterized membrane protein
MIEATRFRRKRAGHLQSKGRYLAAQILAMLKGDLWLNNARHANAAAGEIAAAAADRLIHPVEANEVFIALNGAERAAPRAAGFAFTIGTTPPPALSPHGTARRRKCWRWPKPCAVYERRDQGRRFGQFRHRQPDLGQHMAGHQGPDRLQPAGVDGDVALYHRRHRHGGAGGLSRRSLALSRRAVGLAALVGFFQFCANFQLVYRAEDHVPSGLVAVLYALMIVPNALLGRIASNPRSAGAFWPGRGWRSSASPC